MTIFLKRFNCAKSQTQLITAGNNYSEDQLAEILLTSAYSTRKPHYSIIINIHADKRNNGETMLFSKIETRFIKTGEMTIKRKQQTRQHSDNLSSQKDLGTPSCKLNEARLSEANLELRLDKSIMTTHTIVSTRHQLETHPRN
jgi:hypothetical protein